MRALIEAQAGPFRARAADGVAAPRRRRKVIHQGRLPRTPTGGRLRALSAGGTVLATATVLALLPGSALAAPTTTFNYTNGVQTYVVPSGVSAIDVTATGATGGASDTSGYPGGEGGTVESDIPVTPGSLSLFFELRPLCLELAELHGGYRADPGAGI